MPVSIQQLRERRAAKAAEARKLMDETKDQKWTNEHQANMTTSPVKLLRWTVS